MNGYREFNSAADLKAHYAALKKRTFAPVVKIKPKGDRDWLFIASPYVPQSKKNIDELLFLLGKIRTAVLSTLKIREVDFLSHRRIKSVSFARQMFYYLVRKHTREPYLEIGRHAGGRDHTTVMHGIRKIEALVKTGDAKTTGFIEAIEKELWA